MPFLNSTMTRSCCWFCRALNSTQELHELMGSLADAKVSSFFFLSLLLLPNNVVLFWDSSRHDALISFIYSCVIFQPTVLTVTLMLHCCVRLSVVVCCLSVTLCIVAKRCVLEHKLLLRAYRKSYVRNRLVPK